MHTVAIIRLATHEKEKKEKEINIGKTYIASVCYAYCGDQKITSLSILTCAKLNKKAKVTY